MQKDALAVFLKSARESANLTQKDLADKLEYDTSQFVSNWERGTAPFPLRNVEPFIKLTKCSSSKLKELLIARKTAEISSYFPVKAKKK
jgi:transcriptional regulator with XRE-family HTH domain